MLAEALAAASMAEALAAASMAEALAAAGVPCHFLNAKNDAAFKSYL